MTGRAAKADAKKAVCLVSGGMDSAVAAGMAREAGSEIYALSFDYGQRHRFELTAAAAVAKWLGAQDHRTVKVDLGSFGGSALTDDISVPKGGSQAGVIPVTYVPARNTIFLSLALGWAEVLGAERIVMGANAVDYSGYPDCRPEFIEAFQKVAYAGTKAGLEGRAPKVWAPLLAMSKADIVREGMRLGLDFGITFSCYDPDDGGNPCGRCDSCLLRLKGFREAGVEDPAGR